MKWAVRTCQILPFVEYYHNWWSDKSNQIIIDGRIRAWNQIIIARQLPKAVLQNWFWSKYILRNCLLSSSSCCHFAFTACAMLMKTNQRGSCLIQQSDVIYIAMHARGRVLHCNALREKSYSSEMKTISFLMMSFCKFTEAKVVHYRGFVNKDGLAGALWKCSFCIWIGNIAFNATCQSSQPGSQCAKRPFWKPPASPATSGRSGQRLPWTQWIGFHSPVGQFSPAGGAVVVGLVLVGKPMQTHCNLDLRYIWFEPTNVFGLKTLGGKELEPVVSLLLGLDRHTITISWGQCFEPDNFPPFLYDCPSSVVASRPFTYLKINSQSFYYPSNQSGAGEYASVTYHSVIIAGPWNSLSHNWSQEVKSLNWSW